MERLLLNGVLELLKLSQNLFFLQLLLLWFYSPFSFGLKNCEEVTRALFESLNIGGIQLKRWPNSKTPTVIVSQTMMVGHHGGNRLRLERIGSSWGSFFAAAPNAPQGDPHRFIETYGKSVSTFFGFSIESENKIVVPDFLEFTGALDKLNQQLISDTKDPIALSFFAIKTEAGPTQYLSEFANRGKIPLAAEGNSLIHDLSFHAPGIYLPKRLIDQMRFQTDIVLEFCDFLEQLANQPATHRGALTPQEIRDAIRVIKMARLVEIDAATANLTTAAAFVDPNDPEMTKKARHMFTEQYNEHIYSGRSPVNFLSPFLENTRLFTSPKFFRTWKQNRSFLWFHWQRPVTQKYLKRIVDKVSPLHETFLTTRSMRPNDNQRYEVTADNICLSIQQRREEIHKAVETLSATALDRSP